MDLEEVAEQLYALPREEFTAARDARAKEARAAGQRELAEAVKRLAKPTAAAALANRLAREHPREVRSLLDVGDALRAATAARDGAELRRLAPRQSELLRALADRADRLAADAGQRVTDDTARGLDETLRAAVADPDLGAQLTAGRLTDVLAHSGFPTLGFAPAPATSAEPADPEPAPPKPSSKGGAAKDGTADPRRAEQLARAEQEVADLRSRTDAAEAAWVAAEQELTEASDEAAEAARRVRRLRDELVRAEAEHDRIAKRAARAQKALERAEAAAETATARLGQATAARDRLADPHRPLRPAPPAQ